MEAALKQFALTINAPSEVRQGEWFEIHGSLTPPFTCDIWLSDEIPQAGYIRTTKVYRFLPRALSGYPKPEFAIMGRYRAYAKFPLAPLLPKQTHLFYTSAFLHKGPTIPLQFLKLATSEKTQVVVVA